jgi:hypothetical protein
MSQRVIWVKAWSELSELTSGLREVKRAELTSELSEGVKRAEWANQWVEWRSEASWANQWAEWRREAS